MHGRYKNMLYTASERHGVTCTNDFIRLLENSAVRRILRTPIQRTDSHGLMHSWSYVLPLDMQRCIIE